MSTPLMCFVEYLNKNNLLNINEISAKELDEKVSELLVYEKQALCDFWIEGNKQGWAMQTDWPQDAEIYYDKYFNFK
jgi:hypothetical protein